MVRLAELKDISRIAEINIYGWRNAYRGIVDDIFLFCELSVEKSIGRLKKELSSQSGSSAFYVYEDDGDGIIKGMMRTGMCRDDDKPDGFELMAIYVEKAFERSGVGSKLITYFEKEAKKLGMHELYIWVFQENRIARNFYELHGFKPDGKTQVHEALKAPEMRYVKIV
ncbi:GNAT family N-acetyltransferase [Treponema putidum]|uniref:GNAT family N-acetyltransferase n=1 Tax=Treponema putidum TaxID=221027 RepID=A0AAE9MUZ0_9SPIR|nr:GNAT family N-acetyltransferase [Treponema putidum]AIN92956.1 acetyltransferase [Treponema putidum]TWI74243.1 L-amino acid N-acyltransferase YncA [Treponema putidum]UTY29204.1 GNAT family N-acetyltransferase [Treponema putidum]UTY31602.1 GNAT family N-acetyltransferase [Treponema putidum]UTY34055.1 GNAT family N-acetyltransferase [Treponema putidum]